MRVLIVDDSSTMRRIIANTLKKLGYDDVVEAGDGTEGLQKVAQGKPGLILTDWNMPKMDGREFVKTLRTQSGMEAVPVLMVTTHAERTDVVLALQAGVNDYVVKPFTPETLKEKIEALLGKTAA
ncbi:MAG: response regulator [Acidobacteria bacterium]|nr:response regulator [Acidobacteriota bacterium]